MLVDVEDEGKVGEVGAGALGVSGIVADLRMRILFIGMEIRMMMTLLQPSLDHSSWSRSKKAQARLLVPLLGIMKT